MFGSSCNKADCLSRYFCGIEQQLSYYACLLVLSTQKVNAATISLICDYFQNLSFLEVRDKQEQHKDYQQDGK